MTESRPPFPPFDLAAGLRKVQAAEDAWNTRDPRKVSLAYTEDSVWRNRDEFFEGRDAIRAPDDSAPFSALAFKIMADPFVGKLTYFRVYSGKLKSGDRVLIVEFLARKWQRELDYALRKNLWSFGGNRIAVRFQYESHDAAGQWWRSYGNELWEFDGHGLMTRREASINDVAITMAERRIFGPRPAVEHGAFPASHGRPSPT